MINRQDAKPPSKAPRNSLQDSYASGGEAVENSSLASLRLGGEKPYIKPKSTRGADKAKRLAMSIIPKRNCAQCGAVYKPVKADQSFCCTEHREFYHALRHRYGGPLLDLAILWRRKRVKGGFAAFTRAVDDLLRDHKHDLGHAISDGSAGNGRKVRVK